jgi:hypothetical protein
MRERRSKGNAISRHYRYRERNNYFLCGKGSFVTSDLGVRIFKENQTFMAPDS